MLFDLSGNGIVNGCSAVEVELIHRNKSLPGFTNILCKIHSFCHMYLKMFMIIDQITFTAVETLNGVFQVRETAVLALSVLNPPYS